ncbi:MAG: dienelactone hydrolase family protein [Acidimicrobiia bacterium]
MPSPGAGGARVAGSERISGGEKTNAYREISRDAFGALDYLSAQPYVDSNRIAVIGFSLGANTINSFLIHQPKRPDRTFAAAVAVYGRCHDLPRHPRPQTPLMEIAGELDGPHVEPCRRVASMVEVHVLPGAHHAWDSPSAHGKMGQAGELMLYDAASTERSRELVRDFLARHLKEKD